MRNRILILFTIALLFAVSFFVSCNRERDFPPLPTDYLQIPDYVNSPERIAYWHTQLGSTWTDDKVTTGYADYKFTPVEFILSEIPDVRKPGNIIHKTPYLGDCDDFANFNPYVAYAKLGLDGHVVYILDTGNVFLGHALSYAFNEEKTRCYIWDNEYYVGDWLSIHAYIKLAYPGWIIIYHHSINYVLQNLIKQGHLDYAPVQISRKYP